MECVWAWLEGLLHREGGIFVLRMHLCGDDFAGEMTLDEGINRSSSFCTTCRVDHRAAEKQNKVGVQGIKITLKLFSEEYVTGPFK